jgi:hypothetical protein
MPLWGPALFCAYAVQMSQRRTNKGGADSLLSSRSWTGPIRDYHIGQRKPCARCGGQIDYGAPRILPGTNRVNPRSLVVGHKVGRHEARKLGWTDAQINSLENTQAECAHCSDSSGARYGNALRGAPLQVVRTRPALDSSRDW